MSAFIALQDAQWTDAERNELATIDPSLARKLSRWSLQARILMLNAALGTFSGDDWYGANLSAKLRAKERSVETRVSLVKRNKGGRNAGQVLRSKSYSGLKGKFGKSDAEIREHHPPPKGYRE